MKKFIALTLVLIMAASLPVFVQAEEVPFVETNILNATDWGSSQTGLGTTYTNYRKDGTIKDNTENGNAYITFQRANTNAYFASGRISSAEQPRKTISFEVKYRFDNYQKDTNTPVAIDGNDKLTYLFDNNSGWKVRTPVTDNVLLTVLLYTDAGLTTTVKVPVFQASSSGIQACVYENGTINKTTLNITPNEWHTYKAVADTTANTLSLYVDGNLVAEGALYTATTYGFQEVWTGSIGTYAVYGWKITSSIDDFKITSKVANYGVTGACFNKDGGSEAEGDAAYELGSKIKLTFTEAMDEATLVPENIKLTNAFGKEIAFTGVYNSTDKTYTITPSEALRPKTAHTITLDGLKTTSGGTAKTSTYGGDGALLTNIAKFEFTTEKPTFAITAVEDKGSNTYDVTVQNTTGTEQGYIVAASYTGDKLADIKIVAASAATTYPVTLTNAGESRKFYLISNDGNFKILDIWGE